MVVVSHLFFFFQINLREGMTRCESYPPCFGTIYFPIAPAPLFFINYSFMKKLSPFLSQGKVFRTRILQMDLRKRSARRMPSENSLLLSEAMWE